MRRILVSFCNVAPGAPPLGLIDPARGSFRAVDLPSRLADYYGITGLTTRGDVLYAGVQGRRNEGSASQAGLLMLNRKNLAFRGFSVFRLVQSVHSLLAADNALWAVSTGTDEIVKIGLEHGRPRDDEVVVWRPDASGPRGDIHHLNSMAFLGGDLIVSGFGKKAGLMWSTANNGFVTNTATSGTLYSGIDHPHSLVAMNGSLAYCESRTRSVHVDGREVARALPGYVRGLCTHDSSLFVGTGVGRRVSRSTGLLNNRDDPGDPEGVCAVTRVSLRDGAIQRLIDLSEIGAEIYDLIPVEIDDNRADTPGSAALLRPSVEASRRHGAHRARRRGSRRFETHQRV